MWLNKKKITLIGSIFLMVLLGGFSLVWAQSDPSYYYGGFRRALNSGYNDLPRGIEIDSSGNVYITGYSWGATAEGFYSGYGYTGEKYNASSDDTVLLKYEDLGANYNLVFRDIWPASKNSDGGYAIAIDETRKILYIVGTAAKPTSTCESSSRHNCWDLMVLRYDISVDPPQRLGDPWICDDTGYNNVGFDVEIDSQGYLYIVGVGGANSMILGAWPNYNNFYPNKEVGFDIYYSDIFVAKIDPQLFGSATSSPVIWYQEYSSPGSYWQVYDYSYSLILDESLGRIYVIGYTLDRTSYYYDIRHQKHYDKNLIILRYDLDGNNLDGGVPWITYDSNDEGLIIPDVTFDGILDASGNLVVLARSGDFYRIKYGYPTCWPPKNDRIIKFDKNTGNVIFDKLYSTVYDDFFGGWDIDGEEIKGGIDLDSLGNQYLSGFFWDGRNYTIKNLKVSSTRPLLEWERNFGYWGSSRAANTPNYSTGIKVDSQGNNYTIGYGNSRLTPGYWWIFKRPSDDNNYCGYYYRDDYNLLWKKDTVNIDLKGKPFGVDLDEFENPVVCGVKTNSTTKDFAVVKFASSTGDVLWQQIYDTGGDDEARDVCVDNNGFVYVAGNTYDGTDYDWLLIKYNPNHLIVSTTTDDEGNIITTTTTTTTIEWLMTYDSGGNDKVFGVTCEATSGTFYITGFQDVSGTKDVLTIKYDTNTTSSTSTILWKQVWDDGGEDVGYDLALDKDGYLYLAGKTNNGANLDYLIIKYDTNSTTSPIIWQKTFDNPAGGDVSGDDYATGIVIDNFSSTTPLIYLAGTSYFEKNNPKRYDHTFNWIVIKLDATGNILAKPWYDFATVRDDLVWKITKDNLDNFYFSGLSAVDCYTSIQSSHNWIDIKTDSFGNFNQVVVSTFNDRKILLDSEYFNNNVFSIRRRWGISWDFFLRKLDASNLSEVWSAQWGSQYNDFGMGIAVDSKVNKHLIYFAGYSGNASGNNILRIGKLRKTDAHPWTLFTYNSSSEDKGVKLVLDSQGDLIVLGNKYSTTEWRWYLIKIHWTSTESYYTLSFNTDIDFGDPNLEKYAYGIDLDENDDIYVVGTEIGDFFGFGTTTRIRVAKFSGSDGSLIWHKTYTGTGGEEAYGIVVDKNSNWLYIVGTKPLG
ncbi:SBBP repeat-containing protein, partial [bacterium]|nr:SBBP repeat-containing protein [bacterium]